MMLSDEEEKETFPGGVESYEGRVPLWLMVIYVLLLAWGGWYLAVFWGGFPAGP
jgi:hypothetical protein